MTHNSHDDAAVVHRSETGIPDPALHDCASCGTRPTQILRDAHGSAIREVYDNALVLTLHGGYGMFFDNLESGDPEVVLCHDCAHRLWVQQPWLAKIVDPAQSHSHRIAYHAAHPDHYGWDYDDTP